MISIENLSVKRGGKTVLALPMWEARDGERWAVLGPSGAGKTTLLHVIAGLIKPESGIVTVAGMEVATLSPSKMDRFRGQNIGIVFQSRCLIESMTALENLLLAQYLAGFASDGKRAMETLESLGIADCAGSLPSRLSAGQAQRAAVARATVNRPKVILADEPTSSLDDRNCDAAIDLLFEAAERAGAALIIATHDNRVKPRFEKRLELAAP